MITKGKVHVIFVVDYIFTCPNKKRTNLDSKFGSTKYHFYSFQYVRQSREEIPTGYLRPAPLTVILYYMKPVKVCQGKNKKLLQIFSEADIPHVNVPCEG
jgi:hypothetical protein